MSILLEQYKDNIDRVWYNSSNILFSECLDKKDDLKELTIVFKNGGTYKYKDVNVNDYIMFKIGGLDGSQGKAFNKFIKKYEFEKLENSDLAKLEENKLLIEEDKRNTIEKKLNNISKLQEIHDEIEVISKNLKDVYFEDSQYVILDMLLFQIRERTGEVLKTVRKREDFDGIELYKHFRTLPWDDKKSSIDNINDLIKSYFS